jgi:hypothetical protein
MRHEISQRSQCCDADVHETGPDPLTSRCTACKDNCMVEYVNKKTGEVYDYDELYVDDHTGAIYMPDFDDMDDEDVIL